jgi:hypothetical protein
LTISRDGVLIKEEGEINKSAEQSLQTPVEATGGTFRSSSTGSVLNPTTGTTSPPSPNGQPAATNADGKPKASGDAKTDPKADPKKKDEKKEPKKEEKKGFFGRIFR